MEQKKCLSCGEIVRGRADKKFCDDLCRNAYNNQIKQVSSNFMRNINNALRKNRHILTEILGDKEMTKVHLEKLLQKGFQLKYHTHTYTNKKGDIYQYSYEYGLLSTGNDWYLVVKQD